MEHLENRTLFSGGPTASLKIAPKSPTPATGSIEYIVTYSDPDGINPTTIDDRDLRVTGPRDFVQYARPISSTVNGDGTVRVITYKMSPPGGSWNAVDDGTYTVRLRGDGVSDVNGNFATAKTLGTFTVNIAGVQSVQSASRGLTTAFSTTPIVSVATKLLDEL